MSPGSESSGLNRSRLHSFWDKVSKKAKDTWMKSRSRSRGPSTRTTPTASQSPSSTTLNNGSSTAPEARLPIANRNKGNLSNNASKELRPSPTIPVDESTPSSDHGESITPAIVVSQDLSPSTTTSGVDHDSASKNDYDGSAKSPISVTQEPSPLITLVMDEPTTVDNGGAPLQGETISGKHSKPTCWEKAFDTLTEKEQKVLKDFGAKNLQDFEEEVKRVREIGDNCTNKLSTVSEPKGVRIMPRGRIYEILKKMEEFAKVGDKVVQHSPEIVSLVWTGVRFFLQLALNDMQTFEAISSALDDISGMMGSCRVYERIHSTRKLESSEKIIQQLPEAYKAVLKFMVEAVCYCEEIYIARLGKGVYKPFLIRFQPLLDDMSRSKGELERRARAGNDELQHEMSEAQKREFKKLNDQLAHFRTDILRTADKLLKYATKKNRREILSWISAIQINAHHEETKKLRFEGTGEWLFETKPFEKWTKTKTSSIMWLSGKAGSGKTVLSSLVVDALTGTYKSVPTIYFYCYYGEKERRETSTIIKSLLKQLLALCEELNPAVVSTFDKAGFLTTEMSKVAFEVALSQFEEIFIVIDALDECSKEERRSIVEIFTQLQTRCHVKTFLTSRPEDDLNRLLRNKFNYRIDADDTLKDIKPFVAVTVDHYIKTGELLDGHVTPILRKDLIQTINKEADGMFLWVKYQLNYICEQANEEEVRAQLKKLPRGLGGEHGTYSRIWNRITKDKLGSTESKWALKTLKWLLHAKEPLGPQAVLEATAIKAGSITFDATRKASSIEYLIRVCGGFVALDEKLNVLRFVHYSVQEFLGEKLELSSAESIVAELCLTVLGFQEGLHMPQGGIYSYIVKNWEKHAKCWKKIEPSCGNLVQRFLFGGWCFEKYRHAHSRFGRRSTLSSINNSWELMSRFDLPVILQYLFQQKKCDNMPILLAIAAEYNSIGVVQVLINDGVNINAQAGDYGTALIAAAFMERENTMELLLNAGADINAQGGRYGTALIAAASWKYRDNVKLLLDSGANINAQAGEYGTALIAAAAFYMEHENTVKLLLDSGADINAQAGEYGTALIAAALNGHENTVRLLLDAGADINAQAGGYGTALIAATANEEEHENTVKLLLDAGAAINAQAEKYGTPLETAVSRNHKRIVKLLEAKGAVRFV